jgi:hypothetical protein
MIRDFFRFVHNRTVGSGAGIIWNGNPFIAPVIPAKAGIQSLVGTFSITCGVDYRLRGHDGTWEGPRIANDTSTAGP